MRTQCLLKLIKTRTVTELHCAHIQGPYSEDTACVSDVTSPTLLHDTSVDGRLVTVLYSCILQAGYGRKNDNVRSTFYYTLAAQHRSISSANNTEPNEIQTE